MKECGFSFAAARPEAEARMDSPAPQPKGILVPIDFSEPSLAALRCARALAAGEKAHVTLLNVVEEPGTFHTLDAVGQQRARHEQRAGQLQDLAARELGAQIATRIEVRQGNPDVEIARLAGQRHMDLIVVGRHERHGLRHWLRGHTASNLSKQAPCPVLLLKPGQPLN